MTQKIVVPPLGESVSEATVVKWLKKVGDTVGLDEPLVELETDKITLEVNATHPGTLEKILVPVGTVVNVGDVLGEVSENHTLAEGPAASFDIEENKKEATQKLQDTFIPPSSLPLADQKLSPAVSKMVAEHGIDPATLQGTGKDNRLLKGDILEHLEKPQPPLIPANLIEGPLETTTGVYAPALSNATERVPLSRLRLKIAQRLKEAQNTAAMLTTFNEVDMTEVMAIRGRYKDSFEKKHGVKLGFMSFFTKACVLALKEIPAVNAEIQGEDILYKYHYDIGVAVAAPQGLVVPVVKEADQLSFAAIEKTIGQLGLKAKEGKLSLSELTGGTFTITNGGIFGSLMSTPILNPPQSGILGMHKIQERPVAINGQVVIRPMMYIALTYDHRLIDGREAVTFLVRVKECIENPERLLLDI